MFIKNKILKLFLDKIWLKKNFTDDITYNDIRILTLEQTNKIKKNGIYHVKTKSISDIIVNLLSTFLIGATINLEIDKNDKIEILKQVNITKKQKKNIYTYSNEFQLENTGLWINNNSYKLHFADIEKSIRDFYKIIKNYRYTTKICISSIDKEKIHSIIILLWVFFEGKQLVNYNEFYDLHFVKYNFSRINPSINKYIYACDLIDKEEWKKNISFDAPIIVSDLHNIIGIGNVKNKNVNLTSFIPRTNQNIVINENNIEAEIQCTFKDRYYLEKKDVIIEQSILLPLSIKTILLQALVILVKKYPILNYNYDYDKLYRNQLNEKNWIDLQETDSFDTHNIKWIKTLILDSKILSKILIIYNNSQLKLYVAYSSILDNLYPIINIIYKCVKNLQLNNEIEVSPYTNKKITNTKVKNIFSIFNILFNIFRQLISGSTKTNIKITKTFENIHYNKLLYKIMNIYKKHKIPILIILHRPNKLIQLIDSNFCNSTYYAYYYIKYLQFLSKKLSTVNDILLHVRILESNTSQKWLDSVNCLTNCNLSKQHITINFDKINNKCIVEGVINDKINSLLNSI